MVAAHADSAESGALTRTRSPTALIPQVHRSSVWRNLLFITCNKRMRVVTHGGVGGCLLPHARENVGARSLNPSPTRLKRSPSSP